MKREDIQNPPEVEEIHSDFLQKQKSITENRLSILNQLKLFKVNPFSTMSLLKYFVNLSWVWICVNFSY